MKILGALPSAKILGPLERVFAQAHGAGAPVGHAMIVQDGDSRWRHTLAGLNLEQRRRSIFVAEAGDAAALGLAVRLSVGGALRLPPSTAGASAALAAAQAATQRPLWCADPCVAAEMNGGGQTLRVSLRRPWLWRRLVGDRGALEALAALAVVLERPVLVQQGPVLDLTSVSTEEIYRVWAGLEDRPQWAGIEELKVLPSHEVDRGCDPQQEARIRSWAVVELPSGRPVGRWGFGAEDLVSTHSLVAILDEEAETASWRLFLPGSEEVKVPEVTCESDLDAAEGGVARIPAWLSLDLDREGSPGTVLVKLIVGEAARRGVTLWLPNVTRRNLPLVLRLGSKIWIDGSSVPEQEYFRECNTRNPLG